MLLIHFLDMEPSPAVETRIQKWADRLTRYCGDIQNCQVWIESPHGITARETCTASASV